jgi:WD domain, G-beta repeat
MVAFASQTGVVDAQRSAPSAPSAPPSNRAGADGIVRLWDVPTREQIEPPLRGHTRPVSSVAFSPDGRTVASTGADSTVRLWDVSAHRALGQPIRDLRPGGPPSARTAARSRPRATTGRCACGTSARTPSSARRFAATTARCGASPSARTGDPRQLRRRQDGSALGRHPVARPRRPDGASLRHRVGQPEPLRVGRPRARHRLPHDLSGLRTQFT